MSIEDGERRIEDGVRTDFRSTMDYGSYLDLGRLLDAQHPISQPTHPDELLRLLDNHKNGRALNMQKIWSFYTFIVWYEQFFVLN